jgi:hypothetical protein
MERSKYIAGLAGPTALALGISVLVNRDMFPEIVSQISTSLPLIIVSGVITLVAGLAIVQAHNSWSGWPALITLLGWLLVIGGVLRIVLPQQLAGIAASVGANPSLLTVAGLAVSALGLFLTLKAFR